MSADIQVIGMNEIVWCLKHLPERTSYRVMITGFKKAGKPIQQAGKRHVHKRTRNLMKSIKVFPGTNKEYPAVWIAPTSGKKAGKFDGWYAHFHHFGTKGFGKRTRSVANITTGYARKGTGLQANPFMTLGFDDARNQSLGIIHTELQNSIVNFLRKNLPKKVA